MRQLYRLAFAVLALPLLAAPAQAQFTNKWLAGGDFHNWYSEIGSECEQCGPVVEQQAGWRWPGIYGFTDSQAARGFWIGAENVQDDTGSSWPVRVIHVGPRVRGGQGFFPQRFELLARYDPTIVTVDGDQSFASAEMIVDAVDPELPTDFVLVNEINTLLGLKVERRIYQSSQQFHDDYHILEWTFTNTGDTNDGHIEQTLEDLYFFWQYRMAPTANSRYAVGNGTGWGMNTMIDGCGDGIAENPDPCVESGYGDFRAQFAWHGRFADFTGGFSNLGGPLMPPAVPAVNVAVGDTVGRLAAVPFVGVLTLHADTDATNEADDVAQPRTTISALHSDDPITSNNDAFSPTAMQEEYNLMTSDHQAPRHAWRVEPSGEFDASELSGDPSLGNSGGHSFANGYGPYSLEPGQSVRIVVAEGSGGLSREAATAIGRAYKQSGANDDAMISWDGQQMTKNQWVLTGRDSLFQTFRQARHLYESGFDIPQAPAPPATFDIAGGGDRIVLEWTTHTGAADPDGWEIYRTRAAYDSSAALIHTAGGGERRYEDTTPIRGIDYYYYIQAVQNTNPGDPGTPAGVPLRSSRYATQAYVGSNLKRPQGERLQAIRIVPNPFNIGSSQSVRFDDQTDKLAFFNIPGFCRIEIYTELGELVDTVEHNDGSGDTFWDHTTTSRQVIASGVYIALITVTQDIEDPNTGELLFRNGESIAKKFVIVR